jgi:hypothetical protein
MKVTKTDILEYAVNGITPFRYEYKKTLPNGIDIYMHGKFYHSKFETTWRAYQKGVIVDSWQNSGSYEPFKQWMKRQADRKN